MKHSITLSLRKLVKLKSSKVRKFSKAFFKFNTLIVRITEAVARDKKKLFLNISQYSEENIWVLESLLIIMLQAFRPATLWKRESNKGVFFSKYCKLSENTYLEEYVRTAAFESKIAFVQSMKIVQSVANIYW